MTDIKVGILKLQESAKTPTYATGGAAGADLYACLDTPVFIGPGERALIPTGLSLSLPDGYEGQVRPRSGLALKQGLTVLNAPGTIDPDYTGAVGVILHNSSFSLAVIRDGDRIAQLVVSPVVRAAFELVEEIRETARGTGGFGSTGR